MNIIPSKGRVLFVVVATLGVLGGCSKVKTTAPDPAPAARQAPADVMKALSWSVRHRDASVYAGLLASDFHFYFDPIARDLGLPEYWDRQQDSTGTSNLFSASSVSDVRLQLAWSSDVADPRSSSSALREVRSTEDVLEIVEKPPYGEDLVWKVDGDVQSFYLRKGRSPADTLAGSESAQQWFLVEWHDFGKYGSLRPSRDVTPHGETSIPPSWGLMKSHFR